MLPNYLIRDAEKQDIDGIAKLLSLNETKDYFLPFGLNFKWSYLLIRLLFILLVFHIILNYESNKLTIFNSSLDLMINIAYLGGFSYVMLQIPFHIFKRYKYFGLQNYSQFILLEYGSQIIGYLRFFKKGEYCILNHIYVSNNLKEQLIEFFIKYQISKSVQPVYIACSKKEKRFYINIGFQQIEIQKLPENLRFRGWLNQLFGGKNLVLLVD